MAATDECAQRACFRMADVTVIHSVVTKATGSTAIGREEEDMAGRSERRRMGVPGRGTSSNHGPVDCVVYRWSQADVDVDTIQQLQRRRGLFTRVGLAHSFPVRLSRYYYSAITEHIHQ